MNLREAELHNVANSLTNSMRDCDRLGLHYTAAKIQDAVVRLVTEVAEQGKDELRRVREQG